MPKAEAGTAKAIGNAQKAKGLTKLRFYCQVCEKPCRDENGYKCHIESESHMRKLQAITGTKGEQAGKVIGDFSKQFQDGFVNLLSRRFGSRRIKANQVYQEYIQDRHHLHMSATRWMSLSEFCKHLGREGVAKVEEDERIPGTWFLTWVDNSPAALSRQDALKKMERAKLDDESRQRRFLDEQIRKAKEDAGGAGVQEEDEEKKGLKRDEQAAPIKIGFAAKLKAPEAPEVKDGETGTSEGDKSQPPSTIATGSGFKLGLKSASAAQSAKPMGFNAFKAASKASSNSSYGASAGPSNGTGTSHAPQRMSAAERIMMEETERKRRREERGGHGEPEQVAPKRMRL